MGAYSDLILSYCEIMSNSNDHLVFDAYFLSETSEIDYLIRELKDFYLDKLISGRIMYFIRTFGDDMTDFLIFSQTDYFKYMFSSRILKNLKLLSTIKSIHNPEDETQKEMIETFLRIDQEYLCHIAMIEKDWCSILKKDNLDKVKPFNELLKE